MSEGTEPKLPPEEEIPESVRVTSYPKIIFLWPTWAVSFFFWLFSAIGILDLENSDSMIGWIWIGILAFNLFIVAFDFAAGKFLAIIALVFVFLLLILLDIIPLHINLQDSLPVNIEENFYLGITIIFTAIFAILWVSRLFNYLEVTTQQITYHVGIFADERRYPAPSCHFEKKTEDVFERIMPPWCSKLIMRQEGGDAAEIMDCVPRINKRMDLIKKILEHLKVRPEYDRPR
ncbi:MAG TPA: hypothetical protein VMV49_01120 [Candidatus Deferrimicrobium sp.]|nr:hypothetical protein [Candidatus Deferrimicrobium sp.]